MTDLYRELNKLTLNGCDDITIYQPIFDQASQYSSWYVKRKKVANSMKAAAASSWTYRMLIFYSDWNLGCSLFHLHFKNSRPCLMKISLFHQVLELLLKAPWGGDNTVRWLLGHFDLNAWQLRSRSTWYDETNLHTHTHIYIFSQYQQDICLYIIYIFIYIHVCFSRL